MALQSSNSTQRTTNRAGGCQTWLAAALLVNLFLGISTADDDIEWRTRSQVRTHLQTPLSLTWQARQLREGLDTLARTQRIAIFLDRRVDPGRSVTYTCENMPLETVLRSIARKANQSVGFVGPVVYIGPPLTCARIATLAELRNEQVKDLPPATHKRLLKKSETKWPDLAEPHLLLTRVAAKAGLTIPNIQAVPHDIWRSTDLPKLTFGEQATLMLAGFDMSFRWHKNAREVFLAKFPKAVSVQRAYATPNPDQLANDLKEKLPHAFVEVEGKRVVVRSLVEDHWEIERTLNKRGVVEPKSENPGEERYTLTVKNQTASDLFKLFANKCKFELFYRPDTPDSKRDKRISFSVNEATDIEVFEAIARAAGLHVQTATGKVVVYDKAE